MIEDLESAKRRIREALADIRRVRLRETITTERAGRLRRVDLLLLEALTTLGID